jgi:hypothetical protein
MHPCARVLKRLVSLCARAQYSCTASVLTGVGQCVDKAKDDGTEWNDGRSWAVCDFYRTHGTHNETCKQYISNQYCCGCDGGIQEQIWAYPSPDEISPPPPKPPPPPSPPPPPPRHSPPPPPPPSLCSSLSNDQPNGHCWFWNSVGYCGSNSWVSHNCRYTCHSCPTNRFSNCGALAASGYCSYSFSSGGLVSTACPQSCGVSVASFQILSESSLDPAANALIMPKEVVGEPWQSVQPPMGDDPSPARVWLEGLAFGDNAK